MKVASARVVGCISVFCPPDIVLQGFDGRDSYTILEIKTCEPAGATYIARRHTDTTRGAAHRYLEQTLAPGQYTLPTYFPPTSWESPACASSPWLSASTGP